MSFPRKKMQGRGLPHNLQVYAHIKVEICYNMQYTIYDFAFDASFWLRWNVGSFNCKSRNGRRMRPYGRIFFPRFLLGILQPHLDRGRGLRPLSFAANGTRAKGEKGMSRFANCRKRVSSRRTALIALSVGSVSLLGLVVGCGGDSGRAPNGGLSVKGLYVGMPGDSALKAYTKLVDGSKDLLVVDYRNGIGPELDEETKAKAKKEYEDTVKLAEADIDRFLQWHGIHGGFYDPSREECKGREADDKDIRPYVGSENSNTPIPGANWVVGSAMAAFAGINGYQVEWMLPGKRKSDKEGMSAPKLYSGKMSVPEKMKNSSLYSVWNSEVLEKGLPAELYSKGLQLSKENAKRVFFRLAFEDAQGNPVDKKKLATELVLNDPMFFEEFGSNEEKIEAAEKELEGFLLWGEFGDRMSLIDPDDPRPEDVKARERRDAEVMAEMAKRGDTKGLAKMKMAGRGKSGYQAAAKGKDEAPAGANTNTASPSPSAEDTAELNRMKAELNKIENRKTTLDAEIADLGNKIKPLADTVKKRGEQAKKDPLLKINPVFKANYAKDKARLDETKYDAAKERRKEDVAAIAEMKKKIGDKEAAIKRDLASQEKAIAEAKAAEEKVAAEAKAAEEAALAKKNRTDLRFLTAARTGSYNRTTSNYAHQFSETMKKMAVNCNAMLEWAVLTEPADKLEEITETFSIPAGDYESAVKFASKLDSDLGINRFLENGSLRTRRYFEKDLVDIRSPLWFRLVLKTTNGVEVAKADAVKNWLEARGQFPPDGRLKISKKQMMEVALNNGCTKEKQLKTLCCAWLDKEGNVKKVQFTELGLDRFFSAKDMSGEDFAKALVENYSELPSLQPTVKREDPGRGLIQETTWSHRDPKGYQVNVFERAYYNNDGIRYTQRMLENDAEVTLGLGLVGKLPTKYLTIVATQP